MMRRIFKDQWVKNDERRLRGVSSTQNRVGSNTQTQRKTMGGISRFADPEGRIKSPGHRVAVSYRRVFALVCHIRCEDYSMSSQMSRICSVVRQTYLT